MSIHGAVMVAGNGKDGSAVTAVRIVELLEVVTVLAEEVDYVPEVVQERDPIRLIGGQGVGNRELELRRRDAAAIPDDVQHNLLVGVRDLRDRGGAENVAKVHGLCAARGRDRAES